MAAWIVPAAIVALTALSAVLLALPCVDAFTSERRKP